MTLVEVSEWINSWNIELSETQVPYKKKKKKREREYVISLFSTCTINDYFYKE